MPTTLYRFRDSDDDLLYVGITDNFPRRLQQHAKTKEWWPYVATIQLKEFPTRLEALVAEEIAIRTELPICNSQHNESTEDPYLDPRNWKTVRAATRIKNTIDAVNAVGRFQVYNAADLAVMMTGEKVWIWSPVDNPTDYRIGDLWPTTE